MPPITYLVYESPCPGCQGVHHVRAQTYIVDWGASAHGARRLHVGDRFQLRDLASNGALLTRSPSAGEPLRLLEAGLRCGDDTLFTEVTIEDWIRRRKRDPPGYAKRDPPSCQSVNTVSGSYPTSRPSWKRLPEARCASAF